MRRLLWTAAAVAVAAVSATAHANSVSYAQYAVEGRTVLAVVRLPLDDVDLLLRLDRDLDGHVSDAELGASRPPLGAYLAKHLHGTGHRPPLPQSLGWDHEGSAACRVL